MKTNFSETGLTLPSGKNRQKAVWRSAFLVNSALKIQCHIVKNTLPQAAFSAILPALGRVNSI